MRACRADGGNGRNDWEQTADRAKTKTRLGANSGGAKTKSRLGAAGQGKDYQQDVTIRNQILTQLRKDMKCEHTTGAQDCAKSKSKRGAGSRKRKCHLDAVIGSLIPA